MLLKELQSAISMEPSTIAQYLNVSEEYALTVIERLRMDGLAGGIGTGPVSRNNHTSTFQDFYINKIKEMRDEKRTRLYARWGFWMAVIGTAWQILEWILPLILQKV